ncbi:MAG: 4-vinyl reductase [Candidatus Diapherotrites archaeon]
MLNSFYDKFIFANALQYKQNNFYLANLPFVILPVSVLISIAEKNDKNLDLSLYYSVKDSITYSLRKELELDFGIEGKKSIDFMRTFFTASGWGSIEIIDIDTEKGRAIVKVENSPVAKNVKNTKKPCDTFLRGFLAGIFTIYFKIDVDCVETKCIATGSPNCEFIIKPLKEFNFENPLTRSQLLKPEQFQ